VQKVAIQGVKGCYHDVASYKYFGEQQHIKQIECHSFEEVFRAFKKNPETWGVMAIENTVAGSILPNYSKLMASDMQIVGEVYQRIKHCLLTNKTTTLDQITEVRSHPMALLQCLYYFDSHHHIVLKETQDTALSAKELAENPSPNIAVIASELAAQVYGLTIIDKGIETNPRNFTRFLILRNKELVNMENKTINKASLYFKTGHTPGSLAEVLGLFAKKEVNLTKIQSLPVIGRPWEYLFITDLLFDHYDRFKEMMVEARKITNELQILGTYQEGIKYRQL